VVEESAAALVEESVPVALQESVATVVEAHLKNFEFDEAHAALENTSDVAIYNLLLDAYVQEEFFSDGLRLLDEMSKKGVISNSLTHSISVKLLTCARELDHSFTLLQGLETKLQPRTSHPETQEESLPPLAAVVTRAAKAPNRCVNEMVMTGNLPQVKAVCRTLKKHGFVKKCNDVKFPMNGHWETEHGLNVIIEGKIVRWSQTRASKLKFVGATRASCSLSVYGDNMVGRLVAPTVTGASKTLQWESGEVWHSFGGCNIAHAVVYSSQITKVLRDASQDDTIRKQTRAMLQLLSKDGLSLLPNCLDQVIGYIGNESCYMSVSFESKGGPPWMPEAMDAGFLSLISRRHPQVGFRHCWADESRDLCGQRTVIRGQDVQEDNFCSLLKDCKAAGHRSIRNH